MTSLEKLMQLSWSNTEGLAGEKCSQAAFWLGWCQPLFLRDNETDDLFLKPVFAWRVMWLPVTHTIFIYICHLGMIHGPRVGLFTVVGAVVFHSWSYKQYTLFYLRWTRREALLTDAHPRKTARITLPYPLCYCPLKSPTYSFTVESVRDGHHIWSITFTSYRSWSGIYFHSHINIPW